MKNIVLTLIIVLAFVKAQSQACTDVKELLRKRHTIREMTYGHPYTMFDRHNNLSFKTIISNIRERINKEKPLGELYIAYQSIYTNAILPRPTDDGTKSGDAPSALAIWAKNNAFVFLVGLNANGNKLDTYTYSASRDSFRDRALDAFTHLNGLVTPHNVGRITLYDSDDHNMQLYCRSLIYWLQAYDLLKASYELRTELDSVTPYRYPWGFGDADRNKDGNCAPRRKLRNFARNIYTRSKDFDGIVEHAVGWKKNHGIACASALLMAAQVLNDAGTETNFLVGVWGSIWNFFGGEAEVEYAPNYSPRNWYDRAHGTPGGEGNILGVISWGEDGIEDNFFRGDHANMLGSFLRAALCNGSRCCVSPPTTFNP